MRRTRSRAREIEEHACVGPFFNAGEAGNQDRDAAKHLPHAPERHKVDRKPKCVMPSTSGGTRIT